MVKRSGHISTNTRVWDSWIKWRYVNNMALNSIKHRYNDSHAWKRILRAHIDIGQCMECNKDRGFLWRGHGTTKNNHNILNTLHRTRPKDELVEWVWAFNIPKVNLPFWWLWWHKLLTVDHLIQSGAQNVQRTCLLCNVADKSLDRDSSHSQSWC